MKNWGYVYFLLNRAMPGLIKIGLTTGSIETRIRKLKTSGVPAPFELGAAFALNNAKECEAEVHALLAGKRANQDREFFSMSLHDALSTTFPCISKYLITTPQRDLKPEQDEDLGLDEDDVHFLQFILHDGQACGELMSIEQLKESHLGYHLLELENKLIALANKGLIERVTLGKQVGSWWKMTPKGISYMFEKDLAIKNLIHDK